MASSVIALLWHPLCSSSLAFCVDASVKRKEQLKLFLPAGGQTQILYYDDVVLQQPEQELELEENVTCFSVQ